MADIPNKPITRKEAYLAKIAGQEVQIPDVPITREEAYLDEIARNGGGGGGYVLPTATADRLGGVKIGSGISVEEDGTISASGGGVAKYADLPDKPSINGNELSGNKTGAQLGLQNALTFDDTPTQNSNNPVKSGGVYASDEAIRKWTTAEAKSVSGNPITITDGSARNAERLVVDCEPKQNLHGYDHPWAGGAGKNKLYCDIQLPYSGYGITITSDGNGGIYINGKTTASFGINKAFKTDSLSGQSTLCKFRSYEPEGGSVYYAGTSPAGTYYSGTVGYDTINDSGSWSISLYFPNADKEFDNLHLQPMVIMGNSHPTEYIPYENICPISGYDECVVTVKDEEETTQDTATITFGQTVYGGSVDFKTGKVTVTHASIASYNGETINEPWLSSMDEYVSGTTPTTGAQVVYPLTTPTELTLTPAELELLKGYNYISTNGTTIALDYLPDSLLAEAENYVDAKIPPAPTTDGTYVLTCTVTSGTPAYSWESAT